MLYKMLIPVHCAVAVPCPTLEGCAEERQVPTPLGAWNMAKPGIFISTLIFVFATSSFGRY